MKKRSFLFVLIFMMSVFLFTSCSSGGEKEHSFTIMKNNGTEHWLECTCGEKQNVEEHDYSSWTTTKEPTEEAFGSQQRVCHVCDYVDDRMIPKLDHIHTFSTEYSYDLKGHWFGATCCHKNETKDFEKHQFNNGICSKCSMKVFYIGDTYYDLNIETIPSEIMTKTGYNFLGIFDNNQKVFDENGKKVISNIKTGVQFEAKFEKRKYTFHYVLNNIEVYKQTIEFTDQLPVLPTNTSQEGYDFVGWFDEINKIQYATASGEYNEFYDQLDEDCKFDLKQSDIYLYGKYDIKTYVVQFFDMNDNVIDTQIVSYGGDVVFSKEYPSKTVNNIFYEFERWDSSLYNVKSDRDIRPIYKISLASNHTVFDSITENYDPKNILSMNFGAHYQLNLNQNENITIKVWDSNGVETDKIITLNSDMSLDVIGLSSDLFELNLFYKNETLLQDNIDFEIIAGNLGSQIQTYFLDNNISIDLITTEELALIEELNLSGEFTNETNELNNLLGIKYLTGLKKLDISNNEINEEYISQILPTLKNLTHLDISKNKIKNLDALNGNKNLVYLDASNNLINTLNDSTSIESFRRLRKLETLDLSHNEISDLSPLSNLVQLNKINLSHTKINAQTINILLSLFNLKEVALEHSNLTDDDLAKLNKLTNLNALNISNNNNITKEGLENYFKGLDAENKLESFDMSRLSITKLPEFYNLNNLKVLTFNQMSNLTDITSLKNGVLSNLQELSFDDCSSIHYSSSTDLDIFDHLTSLNNLSIANALVWIDRGLYEHLLEIVKCDPTSADSKNPNDLKVKFFAEEDAVSFSGLANYKKEIIIGYQHLADKYGLSNGICKLNYGGQSQILLLFDRDTEEESKNNYKLIIPKEYESLTIYGKQEHIYNIVIELEDRTTNEFILNLHSFQTNGLRNNTTIKTNSNCKLTINAYGDKVVIRGANGVDVGESGYNAIEAYDLVLNCYGKKFSICGGAGTTGYKGFSSATCKDANWNKNMDIDYTWRTGGDGGDGGTAIDCENARITTSNIEICGGAGGNGGDGGDCWKDGIWLVDGSKKKDRLSGGNGGNGGAGGAAIKYKNNYIVDKNVTVSIKGGSGGKGGNHGDPDTSSGYTDFHKNNGVDGKSGETYMKIN